MKQALPIHALYNRDIHTDAACSNTFARSSANTAPAPPMAATPNTDLHYNLAPDAIPQEGVPRGEINRHAAHVRDLCARTVRSGRFRQPDDLQRWAGTYGCRWRRLRTVCHGQLELPPRTQVMIGVFVRTSY